MNTKDVYIIGENKPDRIRRYLSLTPINRFIATEGLTLPCYFGNARMFETIERAIDYNNRLAPYSNMRIFAYNVYCHTVKEIEY